MKFTAMLPLLLFTLALWTQPAAAEELHFEQGSQAHFTLEQNITYDDWYPLHSGWHSKIKAVLDMNLISMNEVEVVVRDLSLDLKNIRPYSNFSTSLEYASNSPTDSPNKLTRALDLFLNTPLHFTMAADGTVKETTGRLDELNGILHRFFDADELDLLAISKLNYDALIPEILQVKKPPAKDKKEDPKRRRQEKGKNEVQESTQNFRGMSKDKIIATSTTKLSGQGWKGLRNDESSWSRTNALVQERTISDEKNLREKGAKVVYKMKIHWKSE